MTNDHANSEEQRLVELERPPSKLTAHGRADQAAAVDARPLAPFFELSLDLCAIAGYDGYYKRVNSAFERVLGYTERESLSRPFMEFIHPDDRQQATEVMQELLAGEPVVHFQDRNICKDGSYRWLEWTVTPVADHQLVCGIGRDITERKRTEDELARYRDHLEEMVAARTRELIEAGEALQKAHRRLLNVGENERKRLAKELHDSVGQRLLAIKMGVDLAASDCELSDEHQQKVQAMRHVAEQCTETIREIRNISHGLYPPTLEQLGLPAALRQLGHSFEPTIRCQLHCQAPLAEARFDSEQEIALFRIAQEAVSNAFRHGKATHVGISLEQQGPALKMTVRDDGVGFDTAIHLRKGWGLLSMAERARAIGGTSAVTSRPGETTVEVSVPVQLSEAEQD